MTNMQERVEQDDVHGYRINLQQDGPGRKVPQDAPGGLFPYQFLHPTISNGRITPSGTYPY